MKSKWAGWSSHKVMVDGKCAYVWVQRDSDGAGWTVAWETVWGGEKQVSSRGSRNDALGEMVDMIRHARNSVQA